MDINGSNNGPNLCALTPYPGFPGWSGSDLRIIVPAQAESYVDVEFAHAGGAGAPVNLLADRADFELQFPDEEEEG